MDIGGCKWLLLLISEGAKRLLLLISEWADKLVAADIESEKMKIRRKEKNVIKPHLKIRLGHCERSEHGPTGFSSVVWCSIQTSCNVFKYSCFFVEN